VHETLDRLRKDGAKVTDGTFIEGPDRIRIELVEGQATKE
jgi:hypothetical protein